MTVTRDVVTENIRTGTTSPQTFSHAGAGSGVKGVLVGLIHNVSATDHVSAVSYGGVALERIQRNTDSAGEPGAAEWWFLGADVPQGTQTVSYTPGATTDDFQAVAITLLGADDLQIVDSDGIDGQAANPSVTLQYGQRTSMAFGAMFHGGGAVGDFVENGNCTRLHDHDFGAQLGFVFAQTTASSGDFAIGGTAASDDVGFAAVAVSEVVRPRLWMWAAASVLGLGLLDAEEPRQPPAPTVHAYRSSAPASASGHFLFPFTQVVLLDPDPAITRIDHASRMLFGRAAQAVVSQPFWIGRQAPRPEFEPELEQRVSHDQLHRYRVGYQTVGQPWLTWPKPGQHPIAEEDPRQKPVDLTPFRSPAPAVAAPGQPWFMWRQPVPDLTPEPEPFRANYSALLFNRNATPEQGGHFLLPFTQLILTDAPEELRRTDHSNRLFFGRAAPAAPTAGQTWSMWKRPARPIEIEEEIYRKPVDLTPFRQFNAGSFIWYQEFPDLEEEPEARRVNQQLLFRFRGSVSAAVARQALFLWPRAKPEELNDDGIVRVDHTRLHRYRTGFQTVGQPWYLWKQPKLDLAADAEPVRVNYSALFFNRAAPAAPVVGQPWYLWKTPKPDLSADAEPVRVNYSALLFNRVAPAVAVVGQPWYLQKRAMPDLSLEFDVVRVNHSKYFMFGRVAPAAPPFPDGLPRRIPRMWSRMFS